MMEEEDEKSCEVYAWESFLKVKVHREHLIIHSHIYNKKFFALLIKNWFIQFYEKKTQK